MIVVDARPLSLPLTGVGRYSVGLLQEMHAASSRRWEAVGKPGIETLSLLPTSIIGRPAPDALWNELSLAPFLAGRQAYLAFNSQVPWRRVRGCRIVAVVHDVVHRNREAHASLRHRLSRENAIRACVARAEAIVVPSDFASDELARVYGRAADLVVPAGPTLPDPTAADVAAVRREIAARPGVERWVLAVGPEIARKNYGRLARAVGSQEATGLVLVGGASDPDVGRELASLESRIPLLRKGFLTQEQLAAWYAVADALAYPSLAEGNGLPLFDARRVGLPILTSARRPMSDNVGPRGVLVDPLDVEALADGLRRVLDLGRGEPEQLPSWRDGSRLLLEALERSA